MIRYIKKKWDIFRFWLAKDKIDHLNRIIISKQVRINTWAERWAKEFSKNHEPTIPTIEIYKTVVERFNQLDLIDSFIPITAKNKNSIYWKLPSNAHDAATIIDFVYKNLRYVIPYYKK